MKTKIILLASLLCALSLQSVFAQVVTEDVLFDTYVSPTDNDFENRFTGGLGLTQITTNGITGGCLTTPNTVDWGNDNAIYCSKYTGVVSYYAKTRISFKYDSTQINSTNSDRAVSIFLRPNGDFNHYVIASVTYDKKIQVVTYSWANSPPSLNLLHNHWYQFTLNTNFFTGSPVYQINVLATVNDLGLTGLTPPTLLNTSSGTFNDSTLFVDSAIQVSFTGTAWGGAKYLDNFRFEGVKSADSCLTFPTEIQEHTTEEITAFIQNSRLVISNNSAAPIRCIELYSLNGQKIFSARCDSPHGTYDISEFVPGVYFLRAVTNNSVFSKKIFIRK